MTNDILKETRSTSLTGRFIILSEPWDPRMSLWVYPPEIVDVIEGTSLLKIRNIAWSLDHATWINDSCVTIELRKYPGNHVPTSVIATIDCIRCCAKITGGVEIPLEKFERALENSISLRPM
jgi:hypothetical protein